MTTLQWLDEGWVGSSRLERNAVLWRAVEAQHLVATMSLVDTLPEQLALEQILEASKPPLPRGYDALDFLLSTPFRYTSAYASRFRPPGAPGIWYGALDRQTACAEIGHWRWKFLMDSDGLRHSPGSGQAGHGIITDHTLFQAKVKGPQLDLTRAPWLALAATWKHPSNYTACHALAKEARTQDIAWIHYDSARHPEGQCAAVLDAKALVLYQRQRQETWVCKMTASGVIFRHGAHGFSFNPQATSGLGSN